MWNDFLVRIHGGAAAAPLPQLWQSLLRPVLGARRAAAALRPRQTGAGLQPLLHVPRHALYRHRGVALLAATTTAAAAAPSHTTRYLQR